MLKYALFRTSKLRLPAVFARFASGVCCSALPPKSRLRHLPQAAFILHFSFFTYPRLSALPSSVRISHDVEIHGRCLAHLHRSLSICKSGFAHLDGIHGIDLQLHGIGGGAEEGGRGTNFKYFVLV